MSVNEISNGKWTPESSAAHNEAFGEARKKERFFDALKEAIMDIDKLSEKGKVLEDSLNGIVADLAKTTVTKHKYSSIELILIAHFMYWVVVLVRSINSYSLYPIYLDLSKMITKTQLIWIQGFIAISLVVGCYTGIRRIRLFALTLSMTMWLIIFISFFQVNPDNMRGSVIILALASGYQFFRIMQEKRRRI